jgi:DNA-binding response OmpR family regulator
MKEKEDLENKTRQITVLLVEDEPNILEDLMWSLERAGFFCLPYQSGDEAIEAIRGG